MGIQARRIWSWTDWFVIVLRFIGFLISLIYIYRFAGESQRGLVITIALFSYAAPQLFYLPGYFKPKIFMGAEFVLSIGYTLYVTSFFSDELNTASYFYMPLFVISYLSTKKLFYWVVPICCVMFPFLLTIINGNDIDYMVNQFINLTLFSAFGFSLGVFLRQKNQLAASIDIIEEKNKELEHYIYQVERITLLEERNRMARELHDTVGHSLTASIVAMEAIQKLINRDQETAKKRLVELISFSRSHLSRMRETVHEMAMNELKLPLEELIRKTAEEFAHQTGTVVIVEIAITKLYTSEAEKLAFLRCLQESLTNAKKHGNASEMIITLTFENGQLSLKVQDNGTGSDSIQYGYGMEGMKQRIESLRGTFQISSKSGQGTVVLCEIPMEG